MSKPYQPQSVGSPVMSFTSPQTQLERRQKAAQLLEAVIDEAIEPRIAINRWPESHDLTDLSLDCAYRALWHFESDETQQQTEVFYLDAQLELLRQIATHLKTGRDLPPYILRTYLEAPAVRFYYPRSAWAASKHFATSQWQQVRHTFQTAWRLIRP